MATITQLVSDLAGALIAQNAMLVTAESCTGGLVAASCTDLAGSSLWFDRGMVTYSNDAKTDLLGVPSALIMEHGAVSEPVARAMAHGAIIHSNAHFSVAITGIAGPGGGSYDKPVGTVWFAWSAYNKTVSEKIVFHGDRASIRQAATKHALQQLLALVPSVKSIE
ncbi:CinA family protein [Lampropedia puyangensis]|uniref:CinA family protein n=1 Tax=Lampropedia puyangensis TaxID=1330072 RepID=A0A4S8F9E3_9BURK|nr:CinA family protein [Lampropedia puyangensis]